MTATPKKAEAFRARLKRGLAFVAIVWGLAGSYAAFELVTLRGADLLLAFPDLFGDLLLSPATRESKTCEIQPDDRPRPPTNGLTTANARVGAWILGLGLGRDAQVRQSLTVDPGVLAASMARLTALAGLLGIPAPGAFTPEQRLLANTEFVGFVERDEPGTAHRLAVDYSRESCLVYKLGAIWGYASMTRVSLPGERSTFSAELRHYAKQAGLPEPVWRPMIAPTPRATPDQINAESQAITDQIAKFLASHP